MKVKYTEEYLDKDFESKSESAEQQFENPPDVKTAREVAGKNELLALTLGLKELLRQKLAEQVRGQFPEVWYSPKAYQSVFESNRAKLDARGVSGIKEQRVEFLAVAKKNDKVRNQIKLMTEMEDVEI